ncbi:MAG: hypothetical protein L0Z73_02650 [Gammaproteobacteria bacterium]|nr:hypothetical protein [Gammaproteobacteria bacterium]
MSTEHNKPGKHGDLAAIARKKRLEQLRQEKTCAPQNNGRTKAGIREKPNARSSDINAFLKDLVNKKKGRKHQLEIIQEFFENPYKFGVEIEFVPHSSNLEELKEKKGEIQYKIDLLRSVLKALEGEMELLDKAEKSAGKNM